MTKMTKTNTEKRQEERERLRNTHPNIKSQVYEVKRGFYDDYGNDLSDHYEIILKATEPQVRGLKGRDALEHHEIENGGFMFTFFESSRKL